MILGGFSEREHGNAVRSPVSGGSRFVLAGIGVQHSPASHHMCDHVKISAKVRVTEVREDGTVAVDLFDEAGEALLRYTHQETFAQVLITFSVVKGKVDLCVLADRVTEIPHAEVQVMRQYLPVLLSSEGSPGRRPLRIFRALYVLKLIGRVIYRNM